MSLRLRWRRVPRERGLAGTCQGERGYNLFYGDQHIGCASPLGKWAEGGYYWWARVNEALLNTAHQPVATVAEAKAQAVAWARERIQAAPIAGK